MGKKGLTRTDFAKTLVVGGAALIDI